MRIKYLEIMRFFIKFLCIYTLFFQSCNIASGSYPYAEKYIIDYPEDSVISAIKVFKRENPKFTVPQVTIDDTNFWNLEDGKTKDSLWYSFYFYYKPENEIILTLVRQSEKKKTIISLVSINKGLKVGQWQRINKDLISKENRKQKEKFENEILKKIEAMLQS